MGECTGQPRIALVSGIAWETCIREVWDPDRPYGIVVKGCRTRVPRGLRVRRVFGFSPAGCKSIAVAVPRSNEYRLIPASHRRGQRLKRRTELLLY